MLTADIHHITRLRVNCDGKGVRSVIFLHGCPLNCFWCCNPEMRYTENYKTLTTGQLNDYIAKDKIYFLHSEGGITFCGGEPLLYSDFIKEYIIEFCEGLCVNIETSLYAEKEKFASLVPLINEWYVDFKICNEEKHRKYTGKSNRIIKDNLTFLSQKTDASKIIITVPIINGYNTSEPEIYEAIQFLKEIGLSKVSLHPYRKQAEKKHQQLGLPFTAVEEDNSLTYKTVKKLFADNGFEVLKNDIRIEKEKCRYLKNIRKAVCTQNNIELEIKDCSFHGRCTGTCPQCEQELSFINEFFKDDKNGRSKNESDTL